jgi:hypothetical protein
VLIGDVSGDIYLDKSLGPADRARALKEALADYRAHPQVAGAFARDQLANTPMPSGDPLRWTLIQRARASFNAERSGDILVFLKPHIMPIVDTSRYVATHGSPWDYDRRVPIAFWRKGMAPTNHQESAETADIMPTLAAMLGLSLGPPAIDGKCLAGVSGVVCPTR